MISSLTDLVRKFSPLMLFISETKCSYSDIRRIQCKLCFEHSECVEAEGKAGGLPMFWSDDISVRVGVKNSHVMDAIIRDKYGVGWRMSGIYGWADGGSKVKTWELINDLGRDNSLPWLIGGDFNEILWANEKV